MVVAFLQPGTKPDVSRPGPAEVFDNQQRPLASVPLPATKSRLVKLFETLARPAESGYL